MTTTTSSNDGNDQEMHRSSLDDVPSCLPPQAGPRKSALMKGLPKAGSYEGTREALDRALQQETWTQGKPFKPSRTQAKVATGFTSLADVVGAVVTARVLASPWAIYLSKR